MSEKGWCSSREAAEYIGVTPPTLYRLANAGHLGGYRIGRVFRFRTIELDDYLERVRLRPGDLGSRSSMNLTSSERS
ncbi:MAG: hypothetical protein QOI95_32 [Acidimicrobiaceae bacterium]|jgi:excisionase family DNA binding protein